MMKVIGITGGVGAGKSQILEYLNNKYGATICIADDVAKSLQKKGGECYAPIVEHFGEEILDEKGELNRSKLASIVFTNSEELEVLNNIVHPAVKAEVRHLMNKEEKKNTNLFILESALLVEEDYNEFCDELWYIYVKDSIRKNRLIYSRGYDAQKVDGIISSQLSKEEFMKNCDRVIDNNGEFIETMQQLDKMVKNLWE